jgi:hypothetical protein
MARKSDNYEKKLLKKNKLKERVAKKQNSGLDSFNEWFSKIFDELVHSKQITLIIETEEECEFIKSELNKKNISCNYKNNYEYCDCYVIEYGYDYTGIEIIATGMEYCKASQNECDNPEHHGFTLIIHACDEENECEDCSEFINKRTISFLSRKELMKLRKQI